MMTMRFILAVAIAVFLSGCSRQNTPYIELVALPEANNNATTPVELVFVYDDSIAEQLKAVTASEWFQQRNAMIAAYGNKMQVQGFELVPTFDIAPVTLPDISAEAVGIFVFARLPNSGSDKLDISHLESVRITIGAHRISATAIDNPSANN